MLRFAAALSLAVGIALLAAPAPAQAGKRPGEIIVRHRAPIALPAPAAEYGARPTLAAADLAANRSASLAQLDVRFGLRSAQPVFTRERATWLLRFDPAADLDALCAAYAADPNILYAEPNHTGSLALVPPDPLHAQAAGDLALIGAEAAWDVQPGAADVTIAVVDSGVDPAQPDLTGAVDLARSFNFVDGNGVVFDDRGHGTRVAAICGAASNAQGIAGVGFGATLLALDVTDPLGVITAADVAAAIDFAALQGADVVNLSLRFSGFSQTLKTACDGAAAQGVLLIAAAGNENQGDAPAYPAAFASVMGVGAVTDGGATRAPFSNFNGLVPDLVELVAPGETVFSALPGGSWNGLFGSGTSFAAPMVAGAAALLKAQNPAQSGEAIRRHLRATATPLPDGQPTATWDGAGRLDAANAVGTAMLPALAIASVTVDDDPALDAANDGDGALDAGEQARLIVTLTSSAADAPGVTGALSTASGAVEDLGIEEAGFGTVPSGGTASNSVVPFGPVAIDSGAGVQPVTFDLALTNGAGLDAMLAFTLETENGFTETQSVFLSPVMLTPNFTWEFPQTASFFGGLTIEPGTSVKVGPGADLVIAEGTLTAAGTANDPITLTSLAPGAGIPPVIGAGADIGPRTEPVDLGVYGEVYYVDKANGVDELDAGTAANPWRTLGFALTQVTGGGSPSNRIAFLVAEGVYTQPSFDNTIIDALQWYDYFGGFEGENWTRDIAAHPTVLDGGGSRVLVHPSFDTRVDGFVLQNAGSVAIEMNVVENHEFSNNVVTGQTGTGILATDARTTPETIRNNLFFVANEGPAMRIFGSGVNPSIQDNVFLANTENPSFDPAVIWCSDGAAPTISNNLFVDNAMGAVHVEGGAAPLIEGNTIVGNSADQPGTMTLQSGGVGTVVRANALIANFSGHGAGGIEVNNSSPLLESNLIAHNVSPVDNGGGMLLSNASPTLRHMTIADNEGRGIEVQGDSSNPIIESSIIWSSGTALSIAGMNIVTITHSDVEGGFAGTGNIDADPGFRGTVAWGIITELAHDPATHRTRLTVPDAALTMDALAGQVIRVGDNHHAVIGNTATEITVWGDATRGMTVAAPVAWELFDYHLAEGSPCLEAGDPASPTAEDIDGEMRPINGTADMGADEFDPATAAARSAWGRLLIQSTAVGATLENVIARGGAGVISAAPEARFADLTLERMTGWGLDIASGEAAIERVTARHNRAGGVRAPGRDIAESEAAFNLGDGLIGAALSDVRAEGNAGAGLTGTSAVTAEAIANGGAGIDCGAGEVIAGIATGNGGDGIRGDATGCLSADNGGIGIVGGAALSEALRNGAGGVSGPVADSRVIDNGGPGVQGSPSVERCLIQGNAGAAVVGSVSVTDSQILGNGSGISATSVERSIVAFNGGAGVTGGSVVDSAIVANSGDGLSQPGDVTNTWVTRNGGRGIDRPSGSVSFSTIQSNTGHGVRNLPLGEAMNDCNVLGNGAYDYFDDQNTAIGQESKDVRFNWWGDETTAEMQATPFPTGNIARIHDIFDTGAEGAFFANYGASGEVATAPIPPSMDAPAFIQSVVPNLDDAVNIEAALFTVVFSEPMSTEIDPAVAFGLQAPFSENVVLPSPGWLDSETWQGVYLVNAQAGDGMHTIRIAGAVAADGDPVAEDASHRFVIDTSGGGVAHNGLSDSISSTSARISWDHHPSLASAAAASRLGGEDPIPAIAPFQCNPAPETGQVIGYLVFRIEDPLFNPQWVQITPEPITDDFFFDTGLAPSTGYAHEVFVVFPNEEVAQWTCPHAPVFTYDVPNNDPPFIWPVRDDTVEELQPYAFTPALVHGSPPVTWSLADGPDGMTVDLDTGEVNWPEAILDGSPHTITLRATNHVTEGTSTPSLAAREESWLLTVTPRPVSPVIEPLGDAMLLEGIPYQSQAPTLLQGTSPVTWSLASAPAGVMVEEESGVVTWPTPYAFGTPFTVALTASNEIGADTIIFTLEVLTRAEAILLRLLGHEGPGLLSQLDANGDGVLDVSDLVHHVNLTGSLSAPMPPGKSR